MTSRETKQAIARELRSVAREIEWQADALAQSRSSDDQLCADVQYGFVSLLRRRASKLTAKARKKAGRK